MKQRGPKKSNKNARIVKTDQFLALNQLKEIVEQLEKTTAYGKFVPDVGEITWQNQDDVESMPIPVESNEEFKEALERLNLIKSEINDQPLIDLMEGYSIALTRKRHAWLWQQNYKDASFQDKNRIWLDLEEADKEVAALTGYLSQRIEQLKHG